MSHIALILLARDLDAQPAGMTPADCVAMAHKLRAYACAWQRETRALDEIAANAQEDAIAAEHAEDVHRARFSRSALRSTGSRSWRSARTCRWASWWR